mgnify:CR=1 FL=1
MEHGAAHDVRTTNFGHFVIDLEIESFSVDGHPGDGSPFPVENLKSRHAVLEDVEAVTHVCNSLLFVELEVSVSHVRD